MENTRTTGWTVVVIAWVIVATSVVSTKRAIHHDRDTQEVINTAEDMIEWIEHDLESEKVDSSVAMTYVSSLEEIIIELSVTR